MKIIYTLRKSKRARSIRISINHEARVMVTIPRLMPEFFADRFVKNNSKWILDNLEKVRLKGPVFQLKGSRKEYLDDKVRARKVAEEKIAEFNKFYNFNVRRIAIRNTKSRWGSCSKKGNLNFNYKIAQLPEKLANYLVVHELCHLEQMNHSSKFWDLVNKTVPDYKVRRKELRNFKP
ncbi:MAG: M48 family metallopeptidase [Candidatus Gracilibacteria bacterium]